MGHCTPHSPDRAEAKGFGSRFKNPRSGLGGKKLDITKPTAPRYLLPLPGAARAPVTPALHNSASPLRAKRKGFLTPPPPELSASRDTCRVLPNASTTSTSALKKKKKPPIAMMPGARRMLGRLYGFAVRWVKSAACLALEVIVESRRERKASLAFRLSWNLPAMAANSLNSRKCLYWGVSRVPLTLVGLASEYTQCSMHRDLHRSNDNSRTSVGCTSIEHRRLYSSGSWLRVRRGD